MAHYDREKMIGLAGMIQQSQKTNEAQKSQATMNCDTPSPNTPERTPIRSLLEVIAAEQMDIINIAEMLHHRLTGESSPTGVSHPMAQPDAGASLSCLYSNLVEIRILLRRTSDWVGV